ncbi:glyoxalase [Falseniella ignava]|uniref:Glyoxalase n=1 Tax=Falseniella ignava TaxID=137730 RepID=A0A2I1JY05_9LACT|nr:VOC family protein [Falseniella ignava]PKY88266.1 glyoxalase [Falseniella ignava]
MIFHQKPATYVGEVQLKVSNLSESIRFYEEVIGLTVKDKSASQASFTTNGKDTLLTIIEPEDIQSKKGQTTGLYHFALLLPTRADLAQVVRHFIQDGIHFATGDHLVSEAIYLADPDGNGIEIYADRDPAEWEWQDGEVAMTTVAVDIEDLLQEKITDVWQGLPENTVMGHIHLQVNDLEENEKFYIDGLGFSVVNRHGDSALFISDHDYHHHIALNTWASRSARHAEKSETGINAYTILFPSEEVRNEKIAQLKKIGATIHEENGAYYTYDPSHIKLILTVDTSN